MLPVDGDVWDYVPGYDSDHSDDDVPKNIRKGRKEAFRSSVEERLAAVVAAIPDHEETPFIDFSPAVLKKNGQEDPPPVKRRTGSSGPAPTFRMEHQNAPIVRATFLANGLGPASDGEWSVIWSGPGMKNAGYAAIHEHQRVNHFPGSTELTRKDSMFEHLNHMAKQFGADSFDFIPETYVLPQQAEEFVAHARGSNKLWIVKPSNAACGRGIFIFRHLSVANLPLHEPCVISHYVDNPLLIQGLKFDLRIYVLVTQYEPLRAYIYREGLARFASKPYSTDEAHLKDAYRHLTNYSINKNAPNFKENADAKADNCGHKWSLSALNKHLKVIGADVKLMWSRIMDLIVKTLLAVEPSIAAKTRKATEHPGVCFEVYGFDILVDQALKPWILEVNLSPSMKAESPLDWQVKSSLLSDAFNLVGVCQPTYKMVSEARMRAQMMQARAQQKQLLRERGSFTGLKPPPKHLVRSAKAWGPGGACLGQGALNPDAPLDLDALSSCQLSMLERSLVELKRCNNFIPLYPTKRAYQRYMPITRSHSSKRGQAWSQMLCHMLFGPSPARPVSPPSPPVQEAKEPKEHKRKEERRKTTPPSTAASPQASPEKPERPERPERPEKPEKPEKPEAAAGKAAEPRPKSAKRPSSAPRPVSAKFVGQPAKAPGSGTQHHGPAAKAESRGRPPRPGPAPAKRFPPAAKPPSASSGSRSTPSTVDEEENLSESSEDEEGSSEEESVSEDDDPDEESFEFLFSTGKAHEEEVARAKKAIQALQPRDSARLVLMAYLLRVSKACDKLSFQERAELAQNASYARLSNFNRRVKAMKRSFSSQKPPRAGRSSGPPDVDSDSDADGRGLVDEIVSVCEGCLTATAQEPWVTDELHEVGRTASKEQPRGLKELTRHLPSGFVQSIVGRRALHALQVFTPAELEQLLQTPGYAEHIGMLPELFTRSQDGAKQLIFDRQTSGGSEEAALSQPPSPEAAARRGRDDERRSVERRLLQPRRLYSPLSEILRARSPPIGLAKMASAPSLPALARRSPSKLKSAALQAEATFATVGSFQVAPYRSQRWQGGTPVASAASAKAYTKSASATTFLRGGSSGTPTSRYPVSPVR